MLNPPVNGKIQGLFKAFECFSSTFQCKIHFQGFFNSFVYSRTFQDSFVYSRTFQACVNPACVSINAVSNRSDQLFGADGVLENIADLGSMP